MTIARRLLLLLAVPLLALVGLGVVTRLQLAKVEEHSRFVAESRIVALATPGNLSRSFAELRVNVRSYLLADTEAQRTAARKAFDEDEREVKRLLDRYADNLVVSDQGRRLLREYQTLGHESVDTARQVMSLADGKQRSEAVTLLNGNVSALGMRLSKVSGEWIQNHEQQATEAGKKVLAFEFIKSLPGIAVFKDVAELDAYLAVRQRSYTQNQ